VATYEYPRRKEADEHAARLSADKRSTHFVQPIKERLMRKRESKLLQVISGIRGFLLAFRVRELIPSRGLGKK